MKQQPLLVIILLLAGLQQNAPAEDSDTISFKGQTAYARISGNPEQDTPILQFKNSDDSHRWQVTSFSTYPSTGTYDYAYANDSPKLSVYDTRFNPRLELNPLGGYAVGGSINVEDSEDFEDSEEDFEITDSSFVGFRVAYDFSQNSQIEFYYSRQDTDMTHGELSSGKTRSDLDVNYFHIGGSHIWNRGKLEPYVTASAGLTNLDPDDSEIDTMNNFSLSFGGGVRVFPTEAVGLYLGGRGFATFVNSETVASSGSEGGRIAVSSDVLWQFQFIAGAVIAF